MTERRIYEGKTYEWIDDQNYCVAIDTIDMCDECLHSVYMPAGDGKCTFGGWKLLDPRIPALETDNKRLRDGIDDKEINQVAIDEVAGTDFDSLATRDLYQEAFEAGAKWYRSEMRDINRFRSK